MLLRGRPSVPCGARVDVAFGASAGIAASLMPTIPEWRWLVIPTPKCLYSKPRSAYERTYGDRITTVFAGDKRGHRTRPSVTQPAHRSFRSGSYGGLSEDVRDVDLREKIAYKTGVRLLAWPGRCGFKDCSKSVSLTAGALRFCRRRIRIRRFMERAAKHPRSLRKLSQLAPGGYAVDRAGAAPVRSRRVRHKYLLGRAIGGRCGGRLRLRLFAVRDRPRDEA
jgi:hypothetical protein